MHGRETVALRVPMLPPRCLLVVLLDAAVLGEAVLVQVAAEALTLAPQGVSSQMEEGSKE